MCAGALMDNNPRQHISALKPNPTVSHRTPLFGLKGSFSLSS